MTGPRPPRVVPSVGEELPVVEYGIVSSPVPITGNTLSDQTKGWTANVYVNRLVRVVNRSTGSSQTGRIAGNSLTTVVIRGAWSAPISPGDMYFVLGLDVAQVLRDALGGGADIDLAAEFDALIAALSVGLEASVDSGIATGGTNVTLVDANKDWALGMWGGVRDSLVQVQIAGVNYLRFTALPVNTATVITIAALPAGVVVAAGCPYSIKRALNPMLPLDRGLLHNVAGYVANADLVADIVPLNTPCLFRVTAAFNAAGILSVETTNPAGGGGAVVQQFNSGVALNNNSLYMFEHLVHAGDTINYQYSVNATVMTFRVQEIIGAV